MVKKYPHYHIINFDKLTYAGNLDNLREVAHCPNYEFVRGDIENLNFLAWFLKHVDVVVHFAAESHVDNSIGNSLLFTKTNVVGTHSLLEAARVAKVKKFIHISTDEVYGDIMEGCFKETDKLAPNNPYSASKAAAEMLVKSYVKTYKFPAIIVRPNNNYGPFQFPEKIISRFSTRLIQNRKVPLHSPNPVRTYIHVLDTARAIDIIMHKGVMHETYNIGTRDEFSNLEITQKIIAFFGKDESYIEKVDDRLFNDLRYSVDYSKIKALGWEQEISFDEGLRQTLAWYAHNTWWWENFPECQYNK
jgi:dTDP-glucose 4,6-dehydratase